MTATDAILLHRRTASVCQTFTAGILKLVPTALVYGCIIMSVLELGPER
jgi:hypothetical protein